MKKMQIAVLTAAVQEPGISRETFEKDPIGAAMKSALVWIKTARELGLGGLELAGALARPDSYVPLEAMLDPVAAHTPVRTPKNGVEQDMTDADCKAIIEACGSDVSIFDIGFFENLLHPDEAIRKQIHKHLLRCARAAAALKPVGCTGVAGFIGRDITLDMDQNVQLFVKYVIPILQEFKKLGVVFYLEPCPMPGWNTSDCFINNIGYCAGMWIKLARICEKYGVLDCFRITYDESHDILMGNTHHGSFAAMAAADLGFVIARFHGKNQYTDSAKVALWTQRGQMIDLGCRVDGQPHPDPAKQGGAWGVMPCGHGQVGIAHYNPASMLAGNEADWLDHQLAARQVLGLDPEQTVFVLEHEWCPARVQDLELIKGMLKLSAGYISGIDQAAAALFEAATWCQANNLPLPGSPNPAYNILGLTEAAKAIVA